MTSGQDDIPVPRLRDGLEAPSQAAADKPDRNRPTVARLEKERRDLTAALVIFLLASIALLILGYRSLALPAFGVSAGWAIRLFFTQKKIDRRRGER